MKARTSLFAGLMAAMLHAAISTVAWADTYAVTLDPALQRAPASGRVILFFITKTGRQWDRQDPINGPFFEAPQPIASIDVGAFKPGDTITLDGSSLAFPESLDKLAGKVRVQAIFDCDQTERSHEDGPGNVFSDVTAVDLAADRADSVKLTLTHVVEARKPRADAANLKWVQARSAKLSEFYGRDVFQRAGVVLPRGYDDPKNAAKEWAAIYVIPGYGGREEEAQRIAAMLAGKDADKTLPQAVWVVLDPESPLGHHGFVDSPSNGPRATALTEEFIPWLESQFRLAKKPEGRIVTGHSSGGWSSLWLQLQYPSVFGACWSRSPDPVDFQAFQMTNLYDEQSMYVMADGSDTPSYRAIADDKGGTKTLMTVRQEKGMEHALDPTGRSGQQWDAWNAMFSPKNEATGLPAPMFDPLTGEIDHSVVRRWTKYDITRVIAHRWDFMGPTMMGRVRLVCGDLDSYYLNRAVANLKTRVEILNSKTPLQGAGYIEIVKGADHGTIIMRTFQRFNQEMRAYLQEQGFMDRDASSPPPATAASAPATRPEH